MKKKLDKSKSLLYDRPMKRERITKRELEAVRRIYRNGEIHARILAAEIGVSENAFYRWISGSRNPGYLATDRIRKFIARHTISEKIKAEVK
jgi:hypothetical protein